MKVKTSDGKIHTVPYETYTEVDYGGYWDIVPTYQCDCCGYLLMPAGSDPRWRMVETDNEEINNKIILRRLK